MSGPCLGKKTGYSDPVAEVYEFRKFNVMKGDWARVAQTIHGPETDDLSRVGGTIFGLWSGLIGAGNDEGVIVSAWPDIEVLAAHGARTLGNIEGVRSAHFARLEPTSRPSMPVPVIDAGVYAHRWFSLQDQDWAEFEILSETKIWPYIESFDGCRIVGLWRNLDVSYPEARALLVTRYPNMATWERTRLTDVAPPAGVNPERYADAHIAVRRRADLTNWTIVRIYRLIPSDRA